MSMFTYLNTTEDFNLCKIQFISLCGDMVNLSKLARKG